MSLLLYYYDAAAVGLILERKRRIPSRMLLSRKQPGGLHIVQGVWGYPQSLAVFHRRPSMSRSRFYVPSASSFLVSRYVICQLAE